MIHQRYTDESEQLTIEIDGRDAAPLGAILRVVETRAVPQQVRLGARPLTIGSGSTADIVVQESTVSRLHARLSLVPDGVLVEDLDSTNGTFYLGQRIERLCVRLGATVQLGSVRLDIEADTRALHEELVLPTPRDGMVGQSTALRRLLAVIERLAGSLVTVLVTGESGVGKELIARTVHERSLVARGPFVAVNCGAIPRELIHSELFGHLRGAFTGAASAREGAFGAAHNGTLFLDEIGELPLDVQPALLRAVELGEIRAVGADRVAQVKVRVVAATHRDLAQEVREGRFREDLYYRLAVVNLHVPPLRERRDDIEPLARQFARGAGLDALPQDVVEELKTRSWPGNARELRNAVLAYVALGSIEVRGDETAAPLEQALRKFVRVDLPYATQKDHLAELFTREYLRLLMRETSGNISQAAKIAGLDRSYLGKLVSRAGLGKA